MPAKYIKVYGGDSNKVTLRVKKDILNFRDVPVEKKLTREELEHLHKCIRFTQQFKSAEAVERAKEESELVMDEYSLDAMKKQLMKKGS